MKRPWILVALILVLVACGGTTTPTPDREYPQIAVATSPRVALTTPEPTDTSAPEPPTDAPAETSLPEPTEEIVNHTERGQIAFHSQRGDNWDIYVMNADGSEQVNLTDDAVRDFSPAWSPDGTRIAFVCGRNVSEEIHVVNADGSEQSPLTHSPASGYSPSWSPDWSPDGTRIAFALSQYGDEDIYVMNADGSEQTNLTNRPMDDMDPAWSPDGSRIAFVSDRDGNNEIYVMNADGSEQTNLTNNPASDSYPTWSPDGTRIAFASVRNDNEDIYVMNVDGSEQTNLTNHPSDDSSPAWSPDGTRIAYISYRDRNWEIYVMNTDGSGQMNLTNNPGADYAPAWSPDALTAPALTTGSDLLDAVQDAGVLVVATDDNYAPQSWREGDELFGFDVEVAKEVAKRLGVDIRFQTPEWSAVTQGYWGLQWDVSIGSMAPSEERAGALWFTDPYYYDTTSFATHLDNTSIRTPDDLAGKKIGVGSGTTFEAYLHGELVMMSGEIAYGPPQVGDIVAYRADQEAIMDLALGDGIRLDAVLTSQRMIRGAIQERVPLREVLPPAFYQGMVFALDKNRGPSDRMIAELNRIIAEMKADGTMSRLSIEWYGANYSAPGASIPEPAPPFPVPTEQPM